MTYVLFCLSKVESIVTIFTRAQWHQHWRYLSGHSAIKSDQMYLGLNLIGHTGTYSDKIFAVDTLRSAMINTEALTVT
jgi:hypothetical protein